MKRIEIKNNRSFGLGVIEGPDRAGALWFSREGMNARHCFTKDDLDAYIKQMQAARDVFFPTPAPRWEVGQQIERYAPLDVRTVLEVIKAGAAFRTIGILGSPGTTSATTWPTLERLYADLKDGWKAVARPVIKPEQIAKGLRVQNRNGSIRRLIIVGTGAAGMYSLLSEKSDVVFKPFDSRDSVAAYLNAGKYTIVK